MRRETDEEYKERLASGLPQGAVHTAEDIRDTYGADLDALAEALGLPPRQGDDKAGTPITATALEARGYRRYTDSLHRQGCLGLYQKAIWSKDEQKKLYFINFYRWDLSRITGQAESWSVDVRMHLPHAEFGVEYLITQTTTITDVEVFYDKVYGQMYCIPDKDAD